MATQDATERPVGERMEMAGARLTGRRSETKWAPLTTEFWAMLGIIVATLIAAAVADNFDAPRHGRSSGSSPPPTSSAGVSRRSAPRTAIQTVRAATKALFKANTELG
jgi:hypothetical protein